MIEELIAGIDAQAVIDAVKSLSLTKPAIMADDGFLSFDRNPHISIVQINYGQGGIYELCRIYVNINSNTELVFDNSYQFQAIEFYLDSEPNIIHSYDADGNKIAEYTINRDALYDCISREEFMTKSTGEIFYPAYWRSSDSTVEPIRYDWFMKERLIYYSINLEGSTSFYVTVNRDLEIDTTILDLLKVYPE